MSNNSSNGTLELSRTTQLAEVHAELTVASDTVASSSMGAGGSPRENNATLPNEIDVPMNANLRAEDSTIDGNVVIATETRRSGHRVECLCLQPKACAAVMSRGIETVDVNGTVRAYSDLGDGDNLDGSTAVADTRQSETAVGTEVSEGELNANLQGGRLALMVVIGRVAQQHTRPSSLPSLADEAALFIVEAGHTVQDSRCELIGIGALFGKYIDRGRLDAYTDKHLDPTAMRHLFDDDSAYDTELASRSSLQETQAAIGELLS